VTDRKGRHVRSRLGFCASLGIVLLAASSWNGQAHAQAPPISDPQASESPAPLPAGTTESTATPCLPQPPLVRLQDYDGPLKKTVGLFSRKLELKAVPPPHGQPGVTVCSLHLDDKFLLFVRDTFEPVTFATAGFDAGIDQADNRDPSFGQGVSGYGKRFGANFADQASLKLFKDFAYPAIFSEDPRYYRLIHASAGRRLLHAVDHAFVAHGDNGAVMFNASEWLGTASEVALSNMYHPGNERGFAPAAQQVGYSVLEDMGVDILREFWPEISHKLKLPFRDELEPGKQDSAS
jgi:hypothetical protein